MAVFYNKATLSYNNTVTDSNIVSGELLEVLSASKNTTADAYVVGDTITYSVGIVNSGNIAFTGLTLTDDLGAYTFGAGTNYPLTYEPNSLLVYVNGVIQVGAVATAGPPLTITGINIPAGGNVVVIYEATVNEYATPTIGGTITNTATITGGGLLSNISDSETVPVSTEAFLSINKSVSPESVVENGQLTYTFVIQNTGNTAAVATDNIIVTDEFNPVLSNITVTFNGVLWTENVEYTYDESTGLFQTVTSQITVPAASFTQNSTTGEWTVSPGLGTLRVIGTV